LLILAAHEIARSLGRDEDDVEVLARPDLFEVDVEAVGKEQRCAFLEVGGYFLVERLLRNIGHQHGDEIRAAHRRLGRRHREALAARLVPALAALAQADDDVKAAVLQIERMRPALTAEAEHGDACPL